MAHLDAPPPPYSKTPMKGEKKLGDEGWEKELTRYEDERAFPSFTFVT
jgi:hypothetical protein